MKAPRTRQVQDPPGVPTGHPDARPRAAGPLQRASGPRPAGTSGSRGASRVARTEVEAQTVYSPFFSKGEPITARNCRVSRRANEPSSAPSISTCSWNTPRTIGGAPQRSRPSPHSSPRAAVLDPSLPLTTCGRGRQFKSGRPLSGRRRRVGRGGLGRGERRSRGRASGSQQNRETANAREGRRWR